MKRLLIVMITLAMGVAYQAGAQEAAPQDDSLAPPAAQNLPETSGDTGAAGSFDTVQSQANQAYQAMMNRQFQQAIQLYEQAAGSNSEYQKMVDFCNAILDRMQEMLEEQMEIFGKTTAQNFRIEALSREEVDRMLEYQFESMQAGQALQDMGKLATTPVADLGLDYEPVENYTLAEYLGWTQVRGANERIWHRARLRSLDRQMVFARREIIRQQQQERLQRIEEFRRRKLETQSGGLGVGAGGFGGGGFGGGGFGGGGGGFGGGGFGGGGFGGGGFGGGGFGGGGF